MNEIIAWDHALFRMINSGLSNRFFDLVLPYLRFPANWIPLYIFFVVFLIQNFKKQGYYVILSGIIAAVVSDQLSSHIIKPLVHRLRPCNDFSMIGQVRLLIEHCGSGFSFPSSHAVNHFTFAMFMITILPKEIRWVKPVLLVWAFMIAFSQVYIGVHFPIDAIFGALLGSFVGMSIARASKTIFKLDLERELN